MVKGGRAVGVKIGVGAIMGALRGPCCTGRILWVE